MSARECALFLLEYADRTEWQMRQKLKEREYPTDEIDEAVTFLKEYRYLDDAAFAIRYVHAFASKKSARCIRAALEQKGIAQELIEAAIGEQPVDEEGQICAFLRKKGFGPEEKMESGQYRKMLGALSRRGYSYDSICKAISSMEETDLSDFSENCFSEN